MKKFTLDRLFKFFSPKDLIFEYTGESVFKCDFSKNNLKKKNSNSLSEHRAFSSLILLLMLFLFSNFLSAQGTVPIIDGNPSEWSVNNIESFPLGKYVSDPFGNGVVDNQFTSSKDFFLAGGTGSGYLTWERGQTKAKNDIANGAVIVTGQTLYFAGDRTSNNGDAQIGFWFYNNGTSPRILKTSPKEGGDFSPEHAVGDLLVLADFTGGGANATVVVYRWVGTGGSVPNANGRLEFTNLQGTVAINNNNKYPIPNGWSFLNTEYDTNEFYEGRVDLGDLSTNTCFGSFLLEARSSQSITASLDDFVAGQFNVKPKVTLENVTVCLGQPATFTAVVIGGIQPLKYSFNGGAPQDSNTFTINPATDDGVITVVVIGGAPNNCESDKATATLKVNPTPICSISGISSVCPNSTSNNYTGPEGADLTYAWSISGNGSIVGSKTGQNVSVTAGASCNEDYTLSLTVSNGINCSATCEKIVKVVDTENPVFTFCPPGSDLGCNPTGLPAPGAATASDNCGAPVISSALGEITSIGCGRSQTRTYTATDGCGRTATCEQVFTWTVDLIKPVIATTAQGGNKGCNPTIVAPIFTLTEACSPGDIVIVDSGITGDGCAKSQTWTANFTDGCLNVADEVSITYTWTVDLIKPVIATTAQGGNKGCNPTIVAPIFTLTEACSPGDIVIVDSGITGDGCAKSQTWTANFTDGCLNVADEVSITYTWTVDLIKPVIATTAQGGNKGCNPTIVAPIFTLTEACSPGDIVIVDSGITGDGCAKSQTWTANFTDGCLNVADEVSITYTWTVDLIKPVIATTAQGGNKGCNPTIVAPIFTLTEACSPGDIVIVDSGITGDGCAKSQTWTANFTDGCLNVADEVSITYTWTVDLIKPVIATTAQGGNKGCNPTIVAPIFTLTEACSPGDIVIVDSGITGDGCAKSQTWTANFTDGCLNVADEVSITYTWTVDLIKPVIATTAQGGNKGCNPTIVAPIFTLTEACSPGDIVIVDSGITGDGCAKSQTWTANFTDGCLNVADEVSITYTWTVDLIKPVIATTAQGGNKGCNPTIVAPIFTLTEACSPGDIVIVDSGITGDGCAKSQTWTANFTDGCLNVADEVSITYTWTVDLIKPVIATTAQGGNKGCNPTIVAPIFTLTEACSPGDIVIVDSGITGDGCAKSQTWTANFTDGCLNVADEVSITYTWTVDLIKPVIATTAQGGNKGCNPTIVAPIFTLTEACSPGDIVIVDSGITGDGCAKSQTWTANFTDGCLNVADEVSITYTWTVDLIKPVIATTAQGGNKGCNPTIVAPIFTLTEACSPGDIVIVDSGITGDGCAKSQTWTANFTDGCLNVADEVSITYTWTVDLIKPVIATTAQGGNKGCNPTIVAPIFTLTEACSPGDIVIVDSGITGDGCAKSQTWTANFTDGCLNVADEVSITYTWTVDLIKPVIATTAQGGNKGCNPTIVAPIFTLTEACSPGDIVIVDSGITGDGCAKSQTWTANFTDGCLNVADEVSITYTWTVDLIKPVIATTAQGGNKGCNPTIVAPIFTLTEACSPGDIVIVDSGITGDGCAKSQTWTANFTDGCLNVADEVSITYTWTVDLIKPVIATTAQGGNKGCNPTIVAPIFTLTEACSPGDIVIVDSGITGDGCAKSQTWTANFTDGCLNVADEVSITYTWTVDLIKPVIATTAQGGNKGCNPTIVAPIFTLTEACSPGDIVIVDSGITGDGCAKSQTWTANFTDGCLNVADEVSITYTWTVDLIKPVIATTAQGGNKGCNPTIVAPIFTLTEACSPGDIVIVDSGITGDGCAKSQTWTANFTDGCLNVADEVSITYTWTVDLIKPVIATTAQGGNKGCNPTIVAPIFTLTEACSPGDIVIVDSGITGDGCAKSQTWTANFTDGCLNVADEVSITYTWTVDLIKPVIATTAQGGNKGCNPTIVAPIFTLTEACSPGDIVIVDSGITGDGCAKSQTWTANFTDGCLNVADEVSITYTWTVDLIKPVIATTAQGGNKGCNPTIVAPIFTLTEACSPGDIVIVDSGITGDGCAKSQTWTANFTDGCLNVADQVSITYTWTADTENPVIAVPDDYIICDDNLPETLSVTWTDNCSEGGELTAIGVPFSSTNCTTTYAYVFTKTDDCGNTATETVYVTRETDTYANCETAFGKLEGGSLCFLEDSTIKNNRWGWTNNITEEGIYNLPLYAGAADCDISNRVPVGNAKVTYSGGKVEVVYNINEGYVMNEAHVNVSCEKYPMKNGNPTVAPGQYTFKASNLDKSSGLTVNFTGLSGPIWIIVHGVICEETCHCSNLIHTSPVYDNVTLNLDCPVSEPVVTTATERSLIEVAKFSETSTAGFDAYPVPFKGKLTIKYKFDYVSDVKIEVFNSQGVSVLSKTDSNSYLDKEVTLDIKVSKEQEQVYIVKVTTDRGSSIKKVMSSR
jgi:hypothetical protein